MNLRRKLTTEALWIVGTASLVAVLQVVVALEPERVTDWRTWAIGLVGVMVRAGAGAAIAWLTAPTPED